MATVFLCACLVGPSLTDLEAQWAEAASWAHRVELRVDLLDPMPLEAVQQLRRRYGLPLLITSRTGGMDRWLSIEPDLVDGRDVLMLHGPEALDLKRVAELMGQPGAQLYKLAAPHSSATECLLWMEQVAKLAEGRPWAAMGLGEGCEPSRIVAPLMGASMVYAPAGEPFVAGQVSGQLLAGRYQLSSRSSATRLLGLLGDPVNLSPGVQYHNRRLQEAGLDAIYVPFQVAPEQLSQFLGWAKRQRALGFSVTMPLKDRVLPLCHSLEPSAKAAQAVNTLVLREAGWHGANTDGWAAVELMGQRVGSLEGKRLVVLGAGATGRATAYEAMQAGAQVTLLSRNREKMAEAAFLGCQQGLIEELPDLPQIDLLVHATRVGFEDGVNGHLVPDRVWREHRPLFLDVIHTRTTQLMERAAAAGVVTISGREMFEVQADKQWEVWGCLAGASQQA